MVGDHEAVHLKSTSRCHREATEKSGITKIVLRRISQSPILGLSWSRSE